MSDTTSDLPGAIPLTPIRRRVLGVLVEKSLTTPESYPLTANATVTACNQKSNRDPVTHYEAHEVDETLWWLKDNGLVLQVFTETGRTDRWKHKLREAWQVERPQMAVLAELFLRGPQAEGELRARASRMAPLASLEDLRDVLTSLAERGFVRRLSPEGRKRGVLWGHLFVSDREMEDLDKIADQEESAPDSDTPSTSSGSTRSSAAETIQRLESELADVQARLAKLEETVQELVQQLS